MYKVAVVQFYPHLMAVEDNMVRLENLLSQVRADLLVLPELVTTGYAIPHKDRLESLAESVPDGRAYQMFSSLAKTLHASLVYGFAEKQDPMIYNTAILVNPDGTHHLYRKTHLFYCEKQLFAPGDTGFFVCSAKNGIRIGMMVCFDWQFPEAARSLALQGAQIICHPANLVLPWCQKAMMVRSLENRVFSVTANRIGSEPAGEQFIQFTGQSQILDPLGNILCSLSPDQEEIGYAEFDPALADNKAVTENNDAFKDRRPAFYTELVKPK